MAAIYYFILGMCGLLVFLACLCACLRDSCTRFKPRDNDGDENNEWAPDVLVRQNMEGGTTNTVDNRCFQGDVQFASGQETVVDHRMPIIFGALPTYYGQHDPARSLLPVDSSQQPSSHWPQITIEANRTEGQQDARSSAVPVPGSETTSYEHSRGVNQRDVDEYELFRTLPTYEEVMRQKQDTASSIALN